MVKIASNAIGYHVAAGAVFRCYNPEVSATIPNWRFGSGSWLDPNWNHCNWFYPTKKPNRTEPAVF